MQTDRPGSGRLLAYGLPGLPLAAVGLPLYIFLPAFYHESLGLPLGVVGLVLLIARIWDVVTDPLVGSLTDYRGSRWGRRKPWMVAGAPLFMLGVWLLMVPPSGAGASHLLLWSLVAYLGWTMIQLPYVAMGAELSGDYHQRSRITVFREGFVVVGTLAAVIVPGAMEEMGAARGDALRVLAAAMVMLLPLALLILLWRVQEPPRPARKLVPWGEGLRLLAENRPFRRLLLAYLVNGMANALPASLFILFATEVLGAGDRIGLLLIVYFLSAVVALPFWLRASRRFGKHRIWAVSMAWAALIFAFVPLLGEGDFHWFLLITILTGFSLGVDQAIPASMQADVVDEDSARGGGGRAGLYFGLWNMATKFAWALAVGIAFPVLDLAGFESGGQNAQGSLLTLSLLYGAAPVAAKLAVIPLVWRFPLDQQRQARLQTTIAEHQRQLGGAA
ncbi:MFS transporter [Natronospira bacteriovora]|uniref:MFS transporter n=1 Tax=Natronospira bacteriovora TaxID=3069753 RepID=A0ABU0W893_9GAMM|nr:MFS transporter [Natronospira sp. AB-CW4]MDQ2070216.1 MFS transporter [Natronospira sp. AB-CW4]